MMHVTAIVLSAGRGLRFKSNVPKPLALIGAKPVLVYSLLRLNSHPLIKEIILAVNLKNKAAVSRALEKYKIPKLKRVVIGGKERQDSLGNALSALSFNTDLVLVHDGARPFINKELITRLIKEASKSGAAILGVPVKETIKEAQSSKIVKKTLKRENLWQVQTPQVFKKSLILKAYSKFKNSPVTDDAELIEKLGAKVKIITGLYSNIKITTPEDIILAGVIRSKLI